MRLFRRILRIVVLLLLLWFLAALCFLRLPARGTPAAAATPAPETAPAVTPVPAAAPAPAPSPSPTPVPTPEPTPEPEAAELALTVVRRGKPVTNIVDGSHHTVQEFMPSDVLTITAAEPVSALYIEWGEPPQPWTLTVNGTGSTQGQNGFLHEYIVLPEPAQEFTITLPAAGRIFIAEISVFGPGARPHGVQAWELPWDEADILCLPTHSDDEFVFFGGVIPWAVDRGLRVQVAYLVQHGTYRRHEMLDSLWEAGVTHYPVTSDRGDRYLQTLHAARSYFGSDHITEYLTGLFRRFKPSVIVGHDEKGDSGHCAHVFYVECLKAALEASGDAALFPATAEQFGLWDVPKCYLHVFGDPTNYTLPDFDTPLASYGGRTAFEVACDAFKQCETQYDNGKGKYQVFGSGSEHDGHLWGLYRSTVGEDIAKNDFFEHLT